MNIEHCYMRDMYSEEEIRDLAGARFENSTDIKLRRVDALAYRDPDYDCVRLYNDLNELYFHSRYEVGSDIYDKAQLVILHDDIRLSCDYIGPSLTAMCHAGVDDKRAWEVVMQCRKIGGHLLWPRCDRDSINPKRAHSGSRGFGISDRIDVALYEIKNFLNGEKGDVYNEKLRDVLSAEVNVKWFAGRDFKRFCDDFFLKGSFVDDDYKIIWFSNPQKEKVTREIMLSYAEMNAAAIQRRNKIIDDVLRKRK